MDFQSFIPDLENTQLQAFLSAFPVTLLHAVVTLGLLFVGSALYVLTSPYKEVGQINEGNSAAAVSFGGLVICLAIPLAGSLKGSSSLIEIALWGAATVVVQLLLFRIVDMILMGLQSRVRDGEVPAAVLLVAAKLACALILSSAMAG